MPEIELRPWQSGDDLALGQLWSDADAPELAASRAGLAEDADSPFRRTIVAQRDGLPVAAGFVAESTVHPERLWVYVEVTREERRGGLGSRILGALRAAADDAGFSGRRLRAKVSVGTPGEQFASRHGFAVLERSRMIEVPAGVLPVAGPEDFENTDLDIEVVATGSVELTEALWSWYRRIHHWDPPADLGLGRVNAVFLSEEAGARGAAVLRRNRELRSFAVSYAEEGSELPTQLLLGTADHDDISGNADDVLALLGQLAATHPVVVETDDSMGVVVRVLDDLVAKDTARVVGDATLVVGD
ncbi:GNAT family N-acetyltransferase [Spelaeicoccus albus]|uniref:GNAT superfamily N-acetyltransferase n=1 Tax=Spelaeicoccus albus TaxID=1280376 RepID=A0A7Z0CYY0_9MICO|nr:GNAT family N-acetyltransferase [Spelaeicoccus albus]NYI65786.1 GNAT superfamily N-acetyltransferase [Spelaeicoccus albus]